MLKFKNKEGKVVGVLKDNASEPEGEFMKFIEYTNEDDLADALPPGEEGDALFDDDTEVEDVK